MQGLYNSAFARGTYVPNTSYRTKCEVLVRMLAPEYLHVQPSFVWVSNDGLTAEVEVTSNLDWVVIGDDIFVSDVVFLGEPITSDVLPPTDTYFTLCEWMDGRIPADTQRGKYGGTSHLPVESRMFTQCEWLSSPFDVVESPFDYVDLSSTALSLSPSSPTASIEVTAFPKPLVHFSLWSTYSGSVREIVLEGMDCIVVVTETVVSSEDYQSVALRYDFELLVGASAPHSSITFDMLLYTSLTKSPRIVIQVATA